MKKETKIQEPNKEQTVQNQMSPQEQEQFDLFVINGMNAIYDENMSASILNKLQKAEDPLRAIAEISVDIINRLIMSAKQNGQQLSQDVLIQGGNVLVGEIIRLLENAGMTKLSEEQKMACWQLAVSLFLDGAVSSGAMTKEELIMKGQEAAQSKEGQKILQTAQAPELNVQEGM